MSRVLANVVLCLIIFGLVLDSTLSAEGGGHAGRSSGAPPVRRYLVGSGSAFRSGRSTDAILRELNARGRVARKRMGLAGNQPQPVLAYLKDHRLFVEDRAQLFSNLINGNQRAASSAFEKIMRDLASDQEFRKGYLKPAMKKLAPLGFKTAAYNAMLNLMQGKPATGLAASRVKRSFATLKANLLRSTPESVK